MEFQTPEEVSELANYLKLLGIGNGRPKNARRENAEEVQTTPLFTWPVKHFAETIHDQVRMESPLGVKHYAVMGYDSDPCLRARPALPEQMPVFLNVNAPWSAFICGSQGSGKSHTLSCILENCLLQSPLIGNVTKPLAGIVFHYDSHAMDSACEAAFLCSDIPVKIVTSPSNIWNRRKVSANVLRSGVNIEVLPLVLHEQDLNAQRMMRLMAVSEKEGTIPLYMEVVMSILKTMAIEAKGTVGLDYKTFLRRIRDADFSPDQRRPLQLRLNLLETFLRTKKKGEKPQVDNDIFDAKPGTLTIIDLTDPFVDPASACVLFDICLALFLERNAATGYVFALDEAHKARTPITGVGG
ncbi:MAG: hypothetical protein M1828_001055 [Chrysothrix sp. TS-e1954]|nr:MAG: hypothetical protein M1828_001055 [Chrysothrix sp. TS-e1954]